jgi:hypothetical protein
MVWHIKKVWTEAEDDLIRAMRGRNETWDAIGAALGVSRWTAICRGRVVLDPVPAPAAEEEAEDPDRDPYPAGHPVTWGVLGAGQWPGVWPS